MRHGEQATPGSSRPVSAARHCQRSITAQMAMQCTVQMASCWCHRGRAGCCLCCKLSLAAARAAACGTLQPRRAQQHAITQMRTVPLLNNTTRPATVYQGMHEEEGAATQARLCRAHITKANVIIDAAHAQAAAAATLKGAPRRSPGRCLPRPQHTCTRTHAAAPCCCSAHSGRLLLLRHDAQPSVHHTTTQTPPTAHHSSVR